MLIRKHFVHPGDDAFRGLPQKRVLRDLPAVQIIFQQLGVVVRHFFEMWHQPFLVHGIAVESSGKLVVHSAARHFYQRRFRHRQQMLGVISPAGGGLLVAFQNEVER